MEQLIKSIGTIDFEDSSKYEIDSTGVKTVKKITFTLDKKNFTKFKDAYDTFISMSSKPEFLKLFRDINGPDATRAELNEKVIQPFEMCMTSIVKRKIPKKEPGNNTEGFYTKKYEPTKKYIDLAKLIKEEVPDKITIPLVSSSLKKFAESDAFSKKFFSDMENQALIIDKDSLKNKSTIALISKEIVGFVSKN